jgi:hypothetical protein
VFGVALAASLLDAKSCRDIGKEDRLLLTSDGKILHSLLWGRGLRCRQKCTTLHCNTLLRLSCWARADWGVDGLFQRRVGRQAAETAPLGA